MQEKSENAEPKERKTPARRRYILLGLAAAIFAGMLYFMYVYPGLLIGPQQPVYFSHRVHAGVKGIACQFCHPFVGRSQNAGLPTVEKCFYCHQYVIPQHPEILKERAYFDQKKPVPWIRIFFTPDYVYFHHRPHVGWNKIDCSVCHGDVKSQDRLVRVNFQMGFCVNCHRKWKAQLDCWLACHR